MSHFDICFKQKKYFLLLFDLIFGIFSTLRSTQTIKIIDLISQWVGLEKLGYEQHAFQPYTYSFRPFSKGGGRGTPPSLYRVKTLTGGLIIFNFPKEHKSGWELGVGDNVYSSWIRLKQFVILDTDTFSDTVITRKLWNSKTTLRIKFHKKVIL